MADRNQQPPYEYKSSRELVAAIINLATMVTGLGDNLMHLANIIRSFQWVIIPTTPPPADSSDDEPEDTPPTVYSDSEDQPIAMSLMADLPDSSPTLQQRCPQESKQSYCPGQHPSTPLACLCDTARPPASHQIAGITVPGASSPLFEEKHHDTGRTFHYLTTVELCDRDATNVFRVRTPYLPRQHSITITKHDNDGVPLHKRKYDETIQRNRLARANKRFHKTIDLL